MVGQQGQQGCPCPGHAGQVWAWAAGNLQLPARLLTAVVCMRPTPLAVAASCPGLHCRCLLLHPAGTFGRVFRAQWRQGRVVAVKIIEIPCFEERVAGKVARECQHAMACSHPCIAATLAAYTVRVRTHLRRSQIMARLLRCAGGHGGCSRRPAAMGRRPAAVPARKPGQNTPMPA